MLKGQILYYMFRRCGSISCVCVESLAGRSVDLHPYKGYNIYTQHTHTHTHTHTRYASASPKHIIK